MFFLTILCNKNRPNFKVIKVAYGSLFRPFKKKRMFAYAMYLIYMAKQFGAAVVIAMVDDWSLEVSYFVTSSFMMAFYLSLIRPFRITSLNF